MSTIIMDKYLHNIDNMHTYMRVRQPNVLNTWLLDHCVQRVHPTSIRIVMLHGTTRVRSGNRFDTVDINIHFLRAQAEVFVLEVNRCEYDYESTDGIELDRILTKYVQAYALDVTYESVDTYGGVMDIVTSQYGDVVAYGKVEMCGVGALYYI